MRLLLLVALLFVSAARAEDASLGIAYLAQAREPVPPVSRLDEAARDEGLAGARLGLADNMTTGRFTGQRFVLTEYGSSPGADPAEALKAIARDGIRFVITDADAPALHALTTAPEAAQMTILNARAADDELRNEACSRNLLHTVPSRAMLADALAQYLVLKRWKHWFLVTGRTKGDRLLAEDYRRAAKRFGAEIVIEKDWTFQPGNARADTGHVALQTEIPAFTQVGDYDVLVVADETGEFGDYLDGRTSRPRPVAGTQGLVATGWSAVTEQWGGMQLQNRFEKQAGRRMTAVDYAAWSAMRAIGEAAIRAKSVDPEAVRRYMTGPDFLLSGFKGQGQSFRAWDGQMRQPILIANARLLVSASPQPGFLHRHTELDTLGTDREESRCSM